MTEPTTQGEQLVDTILRAIEELLREAAAEEKPLEVEPWRGRLFELFVTAHGAGYLEDDPDPEEDLSAETICREIGQRWGLTDAARESVVQQQKLPPRELSKMRLLWSLMRMWMEWTYAWQRWPEFHGGPNDLEGAT
jgi:hypothetical protein